MSYLARLQRREAEEAAQVASDLLACRLDELRGWPEPPPGISAARWAVCLDTAYQRAAKWGSAAQALGWTVDELVRVNPEGWMRLDHRGAFLLYTTGEVVGVTDTAIAFRVGKVLMQSRRRPR